tara:strand:+ start:2124 stop:2474 length:351 start_codon:yes stop_codon:yes gene_type:complete
LLKKRRVNKAALTEQPVRSQKFASLAVTIFSSWSHFLVDPSICCDVGCDLIRIYRKAQQVDTKKWKSVAITWEMHELLVKMAEQADRPVSRQLTHIIKHAWQARHFDGDVENHDNK